MGNDIPCTTAYLFIGEKRSPTAIERDWTWESGHLAARTLFQVLDDLKVPRTSCRFLNAFRDDDFPHTQNLTQIRLLKLDGWIIIGMGQRVQALLRSQDIEHRALIHPAARGRIRKRERYIEHVRMTLLDTKELGDHADN